MSQTAKNARPRRARLSAVRLALVGAVITGGWTPAQPKRVGVEAATADDVVSRVERLEQEVTALRQVLTYVLQDQQQKATLFLQLLSTGAPGAPKLVGLRDSVAPAIPTEGASGASTSTPTPSANPKAATSLKSAQPVITGVVSSSSGLLPPGTHVYFEDQSSGPARNKTLEIRQQDKQFVPAAAVVQRGTRLIFPNYDAVFHNVFSPSPGNSFDLGSYQAGEKARSTVVSKPGVVEIFCNLHSRMSASVLVVPGAVFTAVDAQGRFRLEGVPPGKRTIGVWAPDAEPVSKVVDVGLETTEVKLSIEPGGSKAHLNKHGQPYGSYGE
jgi:plastocyanin